MRVNAVLEKKEENESASVLITWCRDSIECKIKEYLDKQLLMLQKRFIIVMEVLSCEDNSIISTQELLP